MFNFGDYIPHGMVLATATMAAYVFKRHDERDDMRFSKVADGLLKMNEKLDAALAKQSDNHAEVLKLLINRKE
jgi:hypothetical protein